VLAALMMQTKATELLALEEYARMEDVLQLFAGMEFAQQEKIVLQML
jgi:hypothetical protein